MMLDPRIDSPAPALFLQAAAKQQQHLSAQQKSKQAAVCTAASSLASSSAVTQVATTRLNHTLSMPITSPMQTESQSVQKTMRICVPPIQIPTSSESVIKQKVNKENVEKIIRNYRFNADTTACLATGELTALTLKTIVSIAIQASIQPQGKDLKELTETGKQFQRDGHSFIAKLENGTIHIYHFDPNPDNIIWKRKKIKILRALNVTRGIFEVFKMATSARAMERVFKEANMLKSIHSSGIVPGFQYPPTAVFNINSGEVKIVGFIGPKYNMDLHDWVTKLNPPVIQRISCCKSLMGIKQTMARIGLQHLDIKPENFFLEIQKQRASLFLADLEGATFNSDERPLDPPVTTHLYASPCDWANMILAKNAAEFNAAACSYDVYSLAITIFNVLTGLDLPVTHDSLGRPDPSCSLQPAREVLEKIGYARVLVDLVIDMLNPDPARRPTFEILCKRWAAIT